MVPRLESIVSIFGFIYGAGIRHSITWAAKLIYNAVGVGMLKYLKLMGSLGLLNQAILNEYIENLDFSEGFDIDLNRLVDVIEDSFLPDMIEIPDFEFLKVHIPGFELLAQHMLPNFGEEDVWLNLGFGPNSLIPIEDWMADAAGYLLRPDVLGSEFFGDIVSIICPAIGIPRTVYNIMLGLKKYAGAYNDIAVKYNHLRYEILSFLGKARESIASILNVCRVTVDVRGKISAVSEYLNVDQLREWADSVGLSSISEVQILFETAENIDEFLELIDERLSEILAPWLDRLEITLEQYLSILDEYIGTIEANWVPLQTIPDEWFQWVPEFLEWDVFPQPGEPLHDWAWELVFASLLGLSGVAFWALLNEEELIEAGKVLRLEEYLGQNFRFFDADFVDYLADESYGFKPLLRFRHEGQGSQYLYVEGGQEPPSPGDDGDGTDVDPGLGGHQLD
jgi:hypothetical protein